jgi:glycosyltransferase involved in cell wall biosynthesis
MKSSGVMIVIPCWNEAASLGTTIRELPRTIAGHPVEVLVIDDGSDDASVSVALHSGARVVRLEHGGLGHAIRAGLAEAIKSGATWIVTLDADGQYDPAALEELIRPLEAGLADVVFGERSREPVGFGPFRRWLHSFGSRVVRHLTGLPLLDAGSGYRAYTSEIAARLKIENDYDHTLETLFQLRNLNARVLGVPVRTRAVARASRLVQHPLGHAVREASLLLSAWWRYRQVRNHGERVGEIRQPKP